MNMDALLSRLDVGRRAGDGHTAKCPAHEDSNASLSVGAGSDGRILLKCHAGCAPDDICKALGITFKDLFPDARNGHAPPEIVATYDYTDEQGKLLFQVCRFAPKDFRQRRPDPSALGGWNWGTKGVRRVLYNLPKVLDAAKRGIPVLVVEGEKDVAALARNHFTATCNPGGAGKWLDDYSESLRGADVVIVPDNDEPGRKHAELVASKLRGIAKRVRIVTLPVAKDAHDFFAAGKTAADLVALIDAAKEDTVETLDDRIEGRRFNFDVPPPPISPVYLLAGKPVCTKGNLTIINAPVKSGKSAFVGAMIAATFATDSSDTLGVASANRDGRALLHLDTEQSREDHHSLILRATRRAGLERPPNWVESYCFSGWNAKEIEAALLRLIEVAVKVYGGVHSIIIDGVADLVVDVNDPAECNAFVARLHNLAIEHSCAIIAVIHLNPGTDKTRGNLGSQLERKAESNLRLEKDGEVIDVFSEKKRRAPIIKGTGPRFRWSDEVGMHVSVSTRRQGKDAEKIEELKILRDEVFGTRHGMRYSEMVDTVKNVMTVSQRTAERKVRDFRHFRLIECVAANIWSKRDLQ